MASRCSQPVEGKSSRARFGLLVHFTAPTIHAGWAGRITLEMMCLGRYPLRLYPGRPDLPVDPRGGPRAAHGCRKPIPGSASTHRRLVRATPR